VYQEYVRGEWGALPFSSAYGGQDFPVLVSAAVQEMFYSASMAWSLCPLLTQGAVEAIHANANEELKRRYLPNLMTGRWTGTMNLTEPQSGSDMATLKTRAVRDGENYRIFGQKIFITWGEHDMAENIVHLVLARLPDAPPGVKGISLFLVPKFLVNEDGSLGARNDCRAISLEKKLGIHASPTCVMSYGDQNGAIGYLVGEENRGLACMFTMMNNARLAVGLQGVALAERAYQRALEYAKERHQGVAPGYSEIGPIIRHPDVRRMLMTMKSLTEAARAIAYMAYGASDAKAASASAEARAQAGQRVSLLTPLVKGWCTEIAQEVTSLGIQVHGGMGFIEETGAAQYYRDARILPIYEGTNGIQAMDLLGRKTLFDHGAGMGALIRDLRQIAADGMAVDSQIVDGMARALLPGIDALEDVKASLLSSGKIDAASAGSSFYYLMLAGTVVAGAAMVQAAIRAEERRSGDVARSGFYTGKIETATFFMHLLFPRYQAYYHAVRHGAASLVGISDETFDASLLNG